MLLFTITKRKHLKLALMIKSLLYLTIVLAGFTFYFVGANAGYELGHQDGINDFILVGLKRGTVSCHYVKPECKKNECNATVHPKTTSP